MYSYERGPTPYPTSSVAGLCVGMCAQLCAYKWMTQSYQAGHTICLSAPDELAIIWQFARKLCREIYSIDR